MLSHFTIFTSCWKKRWVSLNLTIAILLITDPIALSWNYFNEQTFFFKELYLDDSYFLNVTDTNYNKNLHKSYYIIKNIQLDNNQLIRIKLI